MSFDELKNEFIQFRKMMMDHISEQKKQIQNYKNKNEELTVNIKNSSWNWLLKKKNTNRWQLLNTSHRRIRLHWICQILFDDIEEEALKVEDSEIEEVIIVGEHARVHHPKEQHLSCDHQRLEKKNIQRSKD